MVESRAEVAFTSHGATIRGWLYQPSMPQQRAGIVMAHGLSGVREMFLDRYGETFSRAGFTTLVYDHFGFGASDGEPRQCPAPSLQLEGYRDAVAWLAGQPSVDAERIGIWGSSFSGGEVIILASEGLGITCAVAQVPALGEGGPQLPAGAASILLAAAERGSTDVLIPAVTEFPDGPGVMFEDGAYQWFTRVAAERAPSWRNELNASGLFEPFRPIEHLADAKVPLLMLMAPEDRLTPPAPGIAVAATVPNVHVVEIPGGHFAAYEASFDTCARSAVEWYSRYLCS